DPAAAGGAGGLFRARPRASRRPREAVDHPAHRPVDAAHPRRGGGGRRPPGPRGATGKGGMSRARVLAVVPAYEGELSLPGLLDELRTRAPEVDILVVDDGSRDGTHRVARQHGVPVARHPVNLGVGAALQTGFRYAVERGYEVGVQIDADGQHDPAFLSALLEPVPAGRGHVAIGPRYVARTLYHAPIARRLGMMMFSLVVRIAVGQRIADTTSGFRAYGRAVMEACQHDFPRDF